MIWNPHVFVIAGEGTQVAEEGTSKRQEISPGRAEGGNIPLPSLVRERWRDGGRDGGEMEERWKRDGGRDGRERWRRDGEMEGEMEREMEER